MESGCASLQSSVLSSDIGGISTYRTCCAGGPVMEMSSCFSWMWPAIRGSFSLELLNGKPRVGPLAWTFPARRDLSGAARQNECACFIGRAAKSHRPANSLPAPILPPTYLQRAQVRCATQGQRLRLLGWHGQVLLPVWARITHHGQEYLPMPPSRDCTFSRYSSEGCGSGRSTRSAA